MNDFGQVFSDIRYERMEGGRFLQGLQDTPEYAQAKQAYHEAYTALAGDAGFSCDSREQALLTAADRLRDLEVQFIYRAGIQYGMSMTRPSFLAAGVA